MDLDSRIEAFVELGFFLTEMKDSYQYDLEKAESLNPWFTRENILISLNYWGKKLSSSCLKDWISRYNIPNKLFSKRILIISAGNIPLVSFHDLLSVLIYGYTAVIKMSSKDNILLPLVISKLIEINSSFQKKIFFINDLESRKFHAVIATGSNNSFKYFDYYFKGIPSIIRKNRKSLSIISGKESKEDLIGLSKDIFSYFGLGCRNVSFLFVPEGYNFNKLFEAFYSFKYVINHNKYSNNYDYNKAMCLFSNKSTLENGFIILKEKNSLNSPVSMLYYSYYNNLSSVDVFLKEKKEEIQCVVSKNGVPFGKTQFPELFDYADDVDVINFLANT